MEENLHIKFIRSAVAGKAPSADTIYYGEIAVNYNAETPALYIRDSEDNIVKFSPTTVDTELDTGSTNPVENRVIAQVIIDDEETVSSALNDLNERKADVSYVDEAVSSITIDVDSRLDTASTNPVENQVVTQYILKNEKVTSAALNDLYKTKADVSYVDEAVSSITIDVDTQFDTASTNPVENRVVAGEINSLDERVSDLEGKTPNDGVLTIQKNGVGIGTFSADSSADTTVNITVAEVPASTSSDEGKVLMVNSQGVPEWVAPSVIYGGTSAPDQSLGVDGDVYLQTT